MLSFFCENYFLLWTLLLTIFLLVNWCQSLEFLNTMMSSFSEKASLDIKAKENLLALSLIILLSLIFFRILRYMGLGLELRILIVLFSFFFLWVSRSKFDFLPGLLDTKVFQSFFYYFLLVEEKYLKLPFLLRWVIFTAFVSFLFWRAFISLNSGDFVNELSFYLMLYFPVSIYKRLRNFFLSIDKDFSVFSSLVSDENVDENKEFIYDEDYLTWGVVVSNISAISEKAFRKSISNRLGSSRASVGYPLIGVRYIGTAVFSHYLKKGKILLTEAPKRIAKSESAQAVVREWKEKPLAATSAIFAIGGSAGVYSYAHKQHQLEIERFKEASKIRVAQNQQKLDKERAEDQQKLDKERAEDQQKLDIELLYLETKTLPCSLESTFSSKVFNLFIYIFKEGLTQLVECLAYNEKVSGSSPLFFIILYTAG